jgi:hypothetical protein
MHNVAVIDRATPTPRQIPLGSRFGLAVMALGIAADVVAHLDPGIEGAQSGASGAELSAHLVVFVGMAVVLLGVVIDGLRSGRRSDGDRTQER